MSFSHTWWINILLYITSEEFVLLKDSFQHKIYTKLAQSSIFINTFLKKKYKLYLTFIVMTADTLNRKCFKPKLYFFETFFNKFCKIFSKIPKILRYVQCIFLMIVLVKFNLDSFLYIMYLPLFSIFNLFLLLIHC